MVWECQLDCLWRVGLHLWVLASLEGDRIQGELGLLAVGRGMVHRRVQGRGSKPP